MSVVVLVWLVFYSVRHCLMPLQSFILSDLNNEQNMQLPSLHEFFVMCSLQVYVKHLFSLWVVWCLPQKSLGIKPEYTYLKNVYFYIGFVFQCMKTIWNPRHAISLFSNIPIFVHCCIFPYSPCSGHVWYVFAVFLILLCAAFTSCRSKSPSDFSYFFFAFSYDLFIVLAILHYWHPIFSSFFFFLCDGGIVGTTETWNPSQSS